MIYPTIHLNGTSKKALLEQWETAHEAVSAALRALANAAPHGRDYYPQDVQGNPYAAYYIARDEHCDRMQKLLDVKEDLEKLSEEVSFK